MCIIIEAERQAYARRSRAAEEVMRDRVIEAKTMVLEEKLSKKEISYGKFFHCAYLNSTVDTKHAK